MSKKSNVNEYHASEVLPAAKPAPTVPPGIFRVPIDGDAVPNDALEALARMLYPSLVTFFKSEEGQREFAEWQATREAVNLPAGEEDAERVA
jgi:hypothetical protein